MKIYYKDSYTPYLDKQLEVISTFMKFDSDYPLTQESGNQCDKLMGDENKELWYVSGCKEENVDFEVYVICINNTSYIIGQVSYPERTIGECDYIIAKDYKLLGLIDPDQITKFYDLMSLCESVNDTIFDVIESVV